MFDNTESYYLRKFSKNCPCCHKDNTLYVDDIEFNFDGNQNEYLVCINCRCTLYVKIRFNKIKNIELIKYE